MENIQWCKLTDAASQTRGRTQWGPGVEHTAPGSGELCTGGWIHVYRHPYLAVLLNPIHAAFQPARLWTVEVSGARKDDGELKSGFSRVRTVEEIPLPEFSPVQLVTFGILCAQKVTRNPAWLEWAAKWLSGTNRSYWTAVQVSQEMSNAVPKSCESDSASWAASGATAAVVRMDAVARPVAIAAETALVALTATVSASPIFILDCAFRAREAQ